MGISSDLEEYMEHLDDEVKPLLRTTLNGLLDSAFSEEEVDLVTTFSTALQIWSQIDEEFRDVTSIPSEAEEAAGACKCG
jgi:hypothetical protein